MATRVFVSQHAVVPVGVRSVLPSQHGGVWIGPETGGLLRLNGTKLQTVLPADALGTNQILDMLEGDDDTLWLAFKGAGLATLREGKLQTLFLPAPQVEFLSLLRDPEGGLLASSNGSGLFRVFGGSVQHVTAAQGLGDDHVYGLTLDQQGRLWWSSGHGLSYAPLKDVLETLEGKQPLFRSTGWGREDGVTGEPIRLKCRRWSWQRGKRTAT